MWLMLYRQKETGVRPLTNISWVIEAGACVWGNGTVRRAWPSVFARTSEMAASTTDPNHRRYWWFHCTLLAWNHTYGHAYPKALFWWRVEPDVLVAEWASFIR